MIIEIQNKTFKIDNTAKKVVIERIKKELKDLKFLDEQEKFLLNKGSLGFKEVSKSWGLKNWIRLYLVLSGRNFVAFTNIDGVKQIAEIKNYDLFEGKN